MRRWLCCCSVGKEFVFLSGCDNCEFFVMLFQLPRNASRLTRWAPMVDVESSSVDGLMSCHC
jgi:hypothetical protein